jgi:arabinosaccharide transport system permease protein
MRYGLSFTVSLKDAGLKNYIELFTGNNQYFRWFWNSFILTAITVVLTLFICYFVAYGLSMYQFRGGNLLFFLVLATMMVPFEILMLPLYREIIGMKLINTRAGVVLPTICGSSTIFFFRQYLIGLPKDLLDAGRIDGCTEFGISVRIIMPIAKPAFASMAILCTMGSWNNVLWPMLVFRDAKKFTLPIGLNSLLTPYGNNYDLLIAGSMFSILPLFIVFLCFQRYLIGGITAGALKG